MFIWAAIFGTAGSAASAVAYICGEKSLAAEAAKMTAALMTILAVLIGFAIYS